MIRPIFIPFLLVYIFTATACKKQSPSSYDFLGPITEKSVDEFIMRTKDDHEFSFSVNSYGGDEAAALRMAFFLTNRHTSITVENVCMSACALYILPAAENVNIATNALVAFHPGSPALVEYYESKGMLDRLSPRIIQNANRAVTLYAGKKLDTSLFSDTLATLEPLCVNDLGKPSEIRVKYSFWIPKKQYLQDKGYQVNGFWPENVAEVKKALTGRIKNGTSWYFGYNRKLDYGTEIALLGLSNRCN